MTDFDSTLKFAYDNNIKCPYCGNVNLHQEIVNVMFRFSEDKDGLLTTIKNGKSATQVIKSMLIPGRRDVIIIGFSCEHSCPNSYLQIMQHKGATEVEWLPDNQISPDWQIESDTKGLINYK